VPSSPRELLQSIFESTRIEEIDASLEHTDGDIDRASAILADRLSLAPPPEDSILAIRPDMSIAEARALLRKAHGNLGRARELARTAKVTGRRRRKKSEPLRSLWVDLHGYSARDAGDLVREATANAQKAGDVGEISFCTGKGLHSKGGIPVLRPLVLKLCRDLGFAAALAQNTGVVTCTIAQKSEAVPGKAVVDP
jgi:DNA-nicking Smr family endonuclease